MSYRVFARVLFFMCPVKCFPFYLYDDLLEVSTSQPKNINLEEGSFNFIPQLAEA